MEFHANAIEDFLIDSLNFKLSPTASYVTERKALCIIAIGGLDYQPTGGTRLIRIPISDSQGWLDPSTVRIVYTLVNNDATYKLCTVAGPWTAFRRARCLYNSVVCEDLDFYGRVHEMFHILTAEKTRDNDDLEGFSYRWDDSQRYPVALAAPTIAAYTAVGAK
jgi:hypothetical protein